MGANDDFGHGRSTSPAPAAAAVAAPLANICTPWRSSKRGDARESVMLFEALFPLPAIVVHVSSRRRCARNRVTKLELEYECRRSGRRVRALAHDRGKRGCRVVDEFSTRRAVAIGDAGSGVREPMCS